MGKTSYTDETPRKKKTDAPKDDAPAPIRPAIVNMSGYGNIDEVIEAAPEDTSKAPTTETTTTGDGKKRVRRVTTLPPSPMDDPKYKEIVSRYTFFGASRLVPASFSVVAKVSGDATVSLNKEEKTDVEDYFYAMSKHTKLDPMATVLGRLSIFVVILGELIFKRVMERSELGQMIKEFFKSETKTSAVQNDGGNRPAVVGQDVSTTPVNKK